MWVGLVVWAGLLVEMWAGLLVPTGKAERLHLVQIADRQYLGLLRANPRCATQELPPSFTSSC